jgi:hypothetical protein
MIGSSVGFTADCGGKDACGAFSYASMRARKSHVMRSFGVQGSKMNELLMGRVRFV